MKTLQQKLTSIIVLTSCLVVAVAGIAIVIFDHYKFEETKVGELTALSEIIGANSIAAIDFNDTATAREILSMLSAVPQVDEAALFTDDGTVLAQYQRQTENTGWKPPAPAESGYKFIKQHLVVNNQIKTRDRNVGYIYLRADLSHEKSIWNRYLIVIASVLLFALLVALYVGSKLQTAITQPVMNLARAATNVSRSRDYSIRAQESGTAEIQQLVTAFNNMLDQIAQREHERDNAEQELKQHRDHLEELVQQRTAALESINKELESFSYSVSHDLRAPLRSIHGFSQMLEEDFRDKLNDEGKKYLDTIKNNAIEMGNLIEDLLQLARITRSEFIRKKVDITQLANTTIKKLEQRFPRSDIVIRVANDLTADGDESLLSIAMENLLGNAWKYTGKTEKPVIEVGCNGENNQKPVFYVKDNGAGFDNQYADRIFQAFQRLHSKEEFPGTGVGLATVQRVIDRHGGKIWADSSVGKGTTIFFTLN